MRPPRKISAIGLTGSQGATVDPEGGDQGRECQVFPASAREHGARTAQARRRASHAGGSMRRKCVDVFLHTGQRGDGTTLTVLPQIWQTKYCPVFLSISEAT